MRHRTRGKLFVEEMRLKRAKKGKIEKKGSKVTKTGQIDAKMDRYDPKTAQICVVTAQKTIFHDVQPIYM